MKTILCLALSLLTVLALPAGAQAPAEDDGVAALVTRLESILRSGDRAQLIALGNVAPGGVDVLDRFADDFISGDVTRAVARERDRAPLQGATPGDGFRLVVEFFAEIADHAKLMTARVDVRRERTGGDSSWRIVDVERLSLVEGLYRLRLNTAAQYVAREFQVPSEDLQLVLQDGIVFPVESDGGITGLVLLGRGEMHFTPASITEKGQLRIFAGTESLVAPFESAYVRLNPDDYASYSQNGLTPVEPDPRSARRAQELFTREAPKSFNLDLSEMSPDQWYLVPQAGDFLAEVRTRRFGTITYARNQNQAEDITVFNRERRRTISLYPSAQKLASRGRDYNEDTLTEFDVTSYDIDANIDPEKELVDGRARITVRSRSDYLATLTLRLADSLEVTNVSSPQFGRLLFLRVRNQNAILINLPSAVGIGAELTLVVRYAGPVEAQHVNAEALALEQDQNDIPVIAPERSYLLSNRSYWYPQNSVNDYATARLRIGVPAGWGVVASGERAVGTDTRLTDLLGPVGAGRSAIFTATDPIRYLTVVVSRFVRVADAAIDVRGTNAPATSSSEATRTSMALAVETNPRQQGRGREVAAIAEDVLRFYGTLMNDTPYAAMTVAVVENELPGGHSPGYATLLNNPPPASQFLWRNDPASFSGYPEFFVAHELAHQWWGQAVGWKNYHEQWISEGFSQYFSALYAQKARGDGAFVDMLRQFRRWSLAESDQGPVYLGYRLGHVKGDTRIFRALVYNKGAAVLHMLRRLVGDAVFFNGIRRFYNEQRFQKAGTDDFERAMEAESGLVLDRFFERWIYGATLPRLHYTSSVSGGEVAVRFEQLGVELFDVPVTVTITHGAGRTTEIVVPVQEQRVERRVKVDGIVRQVQVNRDSAALAVFE